MNIKFDYALSDFEAKYAGLPSHIPNLDWTSFILEILSYCKINPSSKKYV